MTTRYFWYNTTTSHATSLFDTREQADQFALDFFGDLPKALRERLSESVVLFEATLADDTLADVLL